MENYSIQHPLPIVEPPYQSGITDPRFPLLPPNLALDQDEGYNLYKGLVDKQGYLTIVKADIFAKDREELEALLWMISDFAQEEMKKRPSTAHMMPLDSARVPNSWRVTITIAFGQTLFTDRLGNDRYGLSFNQPRFLKLIPNFPGDEFDPKDSVADILLLIASDHPYVNVAATRYYAEYLNKKFLEKQGITAQRMVFRIRDVQQGFGRPDTREFLRFNDGIDNLRANIDLERLVFVDEHCQEPEWCIGGSYLVYKKIREMMPVWEAFSKMKQQDIIGREKDTGKPLSRQTEVINNLAPVYPDPKDARDGALNAHIRKVQPRRPEPDLFGVPDLDRRFLRRSYPFFDGIDAAGNSINGLHFIAYMKSIQQQFEHVTNMWQMNPDFPVAGTGIDAMYANRVLKSLDGGYYFCPPAPKDANDFVGSGLFVRPVKTAYKIPAYVYGYGITFVDIDETVFNTFATIRVMKDGKEVRVLNNQEFNGDQLGACESYDFGNFKDAAAFLATSKPIVPVITELKKILNLITANSTGSRIVFLTARSDFDNKELFLDTFRKYGIDIDSSRMFVERSGNLNTGTVAEKKNEVVMKYLSDGLYRRVRLLDDNEQNLDGFLTIKNKLAPAILDLIRKNHDLDTLVDPIEFFAYLITKDGEMVLKKQI